MRLVDQILEVDAALTTAELKFGFGGALALDRASSLLRKLDELALPAHPLLRLYA